MKKFLALVLVFTLCLCNFSVSAFATTNVPKELDVSVSAFDSMTQDELLSLAADIFPEYEDDLYRTAVNENEFTTYSMNGRRSVEYTETRAVSDDVWATLTKWYGNVAAVLFTVRAPVTDSYTSTFYSTRTMNLYLTCNLFSDESFTVNGFEYTLYRDNYDVIDSVGTMSGTVLSYTHQVNRLTENASNPASVLYNATFQLYSPTNSTYLGPLAVSLVMYVGDDQCWSDMY